MLVHLSLDAVESLCANHKTMQWRAHVLVQEKLHWSWNNLLVGISHSGQTETFSFLVECSTLLIFLNFEKLLNTFLNSHESWWFVDFSILQDIFLCSLLDFNVHKDKSVKIIFSVDCDFIIKRVGFPLFGPQRHWDSLSKSIDLKSCTANSTDDTGIVNNFDLNS